MYAIIQKGRKFNLPFSTMFKLFDTCVAPILLYGAEVWGFENFDMLERVHTKFCKIIAKKSKFTHNSTIYGEMGRKPMVMLAKLRMINFWSKIISGKSAKLSSILYKILYHLDSIDRYTSNWLRCVRETLQNCGLNFIWLNQNVASRNALGSLVKNILGDQFEQNWSEKIRNEEAFTNYRIFKDGIKCELYITVLPDHLKFAMLDFRTGSYKLAVNRRNNTDIQRQERLCPYCNLGQVGDEYHFLFQCNYNTLNDLRIQFIPDYYRNKTSTLKMSELLNSDDVDITFSLAKYVFYGLKLYKL